LDNEKSTTALVVYYLMVKVEVYTQSTKINKSKQRVLVDKVEETFKTWTLSRLENLNELSDEESLNLAKDRIRRRFDIKDKYKIKIVSSKLIKSL
jgi:hypothetical protein